MCGHWDTRRDHDTEAVPEGFRYYKLTDANDRTSAPIKIPMDRADDDAESDENTGSDDNKYDEDVDSKLQELDGQSDVQSDAQKIPNSIQSDAPEVRISVH